MLIEYLPAIPDASLSSWLAPARTAARRPRGCPGRGAARARLGEPGRAGAECIGGYSKDVRTGASMRGTTKPALLTCNCVERLRAFKRPEFKDDSASGDENPTPADRARAGRSCAPAPSSARASRARASCSPPSAARSRRPAERPGAAASASAGGYSLTEEPVSVHKSCKEP